MSEDAPAGEVTEAPEPPPPVGTKPYNTDGRVPRPAVFWDRVAQKWRLGRRARGHAGHVKETDLCVPGPDRVLGNFKFDDWRKRLESKTESASEAIVDELIGRLERRSICAKIPTSVLVRTLKYLDERNAVVKKREKEEGVAKNDAPVEYHAHLAQFQYPDGFFDSLPPGAREIIEARRLKAIDG